MAVAFFSLLFALNHMNLSLVGSGGGFRSRWC